MPRTSLPRARAVAALLAVLLCLAPSLARAHTHLVRSEPAAGARLDRAPTALRLVFSEQVQLPFTRVRLLGADERERPLGILSAEGGTGAALLVPITGALAPGRYAVAWQTGGRDGHPVRGRFSFTVLGGAGESAAASGAGASTAAAPSGAAPADTASGRTSRGDFNAILDSMSAGAQQPVQVLHAQGGDSLTEYRVARWAEYVALLAVLGALAFRALVLGPIEKLGERTPTIVDAADGARQLGLGALVLLLAAGCARLYGEAKAVVGHDVPLTMAALRPMVLETPWGRGWLLGALGAFAAFVGLVLARRWWPGWRVAHLGAIGLVLSPALTGHAAATRDWRHVAVVLDAAHVLGAGIWLGTLVVLALAGIPAALRRAPEERVPAVTSLVGRYSVVAQLGVVLVVASGIGSSIIRVRSLGGLTHTSYGSLLTYKVFVFLFVGLVGLYNWKKATPKLAQRHGVRRMRRAIGVELVVGALVLALTAALVATEPPDLAVSSPSGSSASGSP
jgi:putative copper export protein/methionine-rich copper-binding protein CopC